MSPPSVLAVLEAETSHVWKKSTHTYREMTPNLSAQGRDSPMRVYFQPGTDVLNMESGSLPIPGIFC